MNPFLQEIQGITDLPQWFVTIIIAWILLWKGLALWKSAKRNSPTWFVALLVINTIGIFEILYYYLFSEMKFENTKDKNNKSRKRKITPKDLAKQKAFIDE
jgi:methionyl-tRNA synthetase